jgi:hypothetical protein
MMGAMPTIPSPPYSASKAGVSNYQRQKDAEVKGAKYGGGGGGGLPNSTSLFGQGRHHMCHRYQFDSVDTK